MDDNFIFVNDVGPRDGLQNQTIDVSLKYELSLLKNFLMQAFLELRLQVL